MTGVQTCALPISIPRGIVDAEWTEYLEQSEILIRTRIDELAAAAITERPAWLGALGPEPEDSEQTAGWRRTVEAAVAFREEYGVQTDDPEHPLGHHVESGRAGHGVQRLVERLISAGHPTGNTEPEALGQTQPRLKPPRRERQAPKSDTAKEPHRSAQQSITHVQQRGPAKPSTPTIKP